MVVHAQWTQAPLAQIGSGFPNGGAICYSDGVTWAVEDYVLMSLDSGLTWQDRTPSPKMRMIDIFFIDKMNGILVPTNRVTSIHVTSDQGVTWRRVNFTNNAVELAAAAFIGSPNDIVVVGEQGGIYCSHNAGATWTETRLADAAFDIVPGGKGVAYVSSGNNRNTGASLYETTDYGRTWRKTPGVYDWDSYQFAQDQCDPDIFYVANEDVTGARDNLSCVFISTDKGVSWRQSDPHPIDYHCGSVATSKNAIFAQTLQGIVRSTNRGTSWTNIGGPVSSYDTRMVCAINNNIIITADTLGRVWRTGNSGGYPIPDANTEDLTWYPTEAFGTDSLSFCDSMRFDTVIVCPTCANIDLAAVTLTGRDQTDYTIVKMLPAAITTCDTLIIGFKPQRLGTSDAGCIMTLADGRSYSIPFRGTGVTPEVSVMLDPPVLFDTDRVSLCDSFVTRTVYITSSSPCGSLRIARDTIEGSYNAEYMLTRPVGDSLSSYDSIEVTFTPAGDGARDADILIYFADGSVLRIPLRGTGIMPKPSIVLSASNLFAADTICLGDSILQTMTVTVSRCIPLRTVTQILRGNNSSDYRIRRLLPDTVDGSENFDIVFTPTAQGLRDAQFLLSFEDGSSFTIQLAGYCTLSSNVSMYVGSASTSILGETVRVPFTINGLRTPEDVTFSVTYDNSLEYIGVFTPADVPLGLPAASPGWIHVTVPRADVVLNGPSGYIAFKAYSDSTSMHNVIFDSLAVPSAKPLCKYVPQLAALAVVNSAFGCGTRILSRFLRTGEIQTFTVTPNPARTELYLTPSHSIDQATVEITNMLGQRVYSIEAGFTSGQKKRISVFSLPEGVYLLRVVSSGELYHSNFAITK